MYLLPGNPFSQAVEAYRASGEALYSKGMQAVTHPDAPVIYTTSRCVLSTASTHATSLHSGTVISVVTQPTRRQGPAYRTVWERGKGGPFGGLWRSTSTRMHALGL